MHAQLLNFIAFLDTDSIKALTSRLDTLQATVDGIKAKAGKVFTTSNYLFMFWCVCVLRGGRAVIACVITLSWANDKDALESNERLKS